ncbi:hypothetical protein ACA910_012779 [Epithemia clementina (nom. ined.)]
MSAGITAEKANLTYETINLELDEDSHPRRFLQLSKQVFVYGGETGDLVRLDEGGKKSTLVRQWDEDALRAVCVSPNQRFVVVGLECGTTQIYDYADFDPKNTSADVVVHPFVDVPASSSGSTAEESLLSQSDTLTSPRVGEVMRHGRSSDTPIRDAIFLDNQYVVITSESSTFVCDATNHNTTRCFLEDEIQKAHDGVGCRALERVSQNSRLFATLGLDGRMSYWNCTADDPSAWALLHRETALCVPRKDVGEILGADAWVRSCRPVYHSNWLALPGASYWQWRQVIETSSSKYEVKEFEGDAVSDSHFNVILTATPCFGLDDRYWCSIGRDGRVILWEKDGTSDRRMKMVQCLVENLDPAPTDVCFLNDTLYVSTADAKVMMWTNFQTKFGLKEKGDVSSVLTTSKADSKENTDNTNKHGSKRKLIKASSSENGDDEDEDVDFTKESKSATTSGYVDEEAADDNSPLETGDSEEARNGHEDLDGSYVSNGDDDIDMEVLRPRIAVPTLQLPDPQAPFAPSATPLDLPRRFLCWNHIGTITTMQSDGRNTINMQFHDSGFRVRPTVNFTDTMGFIMGSLGEEGGLFATDLPHDDDDDDDDLRGVVDGLQISEQTKVALKRSRAGNKGKKLAGSTIYFHRFETIASIRDKDWYITLDCGERVLGCACGTAWSAVITSRRFLRLFTSGGNQDLILCLSGDPVTIVGRSRLLAVFYHDQQPQMDGTQKLGFLLYDAIANRVIGKGPVSCLSPRSSLEWVGFSADLSLMAMDSNGLLSMLISLDSGAGWEWMPVLDTQELRKSESDRFWPISVMDGKLNCVPLKGGVKYPSAARKPITSNIGLRLPFVRGLLPQTKALEELSVRAIVSLQQKKVMFELVADGDVDEQFERDHERLSAQVDKVTLKMFAETVKAGKLEKALDLVERLHLEKSFELAMILATNHAKLASKIEGIRERRFGGHYFDPYESSDLAIVGPGSTDRSTKTSPDASFVPRTKRPIEERDSDNNMSDRATRKRRLP